MRVDFVGSRNPSGYWRLDTHNDSLYVIARKSVTQSYLPPPYHPKLMQDFRLMVNDCVRIGLANDASTLKRLSLLSYKELRRYHLPSCYKLCAISKAAGMLKSRKKSIRRGYPTKDPYLKIPLVVSCYRFKVAEGRLIFPLGQKQLEEIPLNRHSKEVLSEVGLRVNSFTLANGSLSLSMSKVLEIGENTTQIIASFKRADVRTRQEISSKYGRRRRNRVGQILHRVSRAMIQQAEETRSAIVFEDIRHIRSMYRKGSGQGRDYRGRMNSWPFAEIKRQIEYKAAWEGIPVIHLTKGETRGTSHQCVQCGERLQGPLRADVQHRRDLWCDKCERWFDRDMVAVMNISRRGWVRFAQLKGEAGEAMRGNLTQTVILRVDASKMAQQDSLR